jgi:hypothetical protein
MPSLKDMTVLVIGRGRDGADQRVPDRDLGPGGEHLV